jgi:hypothetical protein
MPLPDRFLPTVSLVRRSALTKAAAVCQPVPRSERGISGGSVYDALIAATVAEHRVELVGCDRGAASNYERYGIRFALV